MSLFRKRKQESSIPLPSEKTHDMRVEVVVEKEANKKIAAQAKEANRVLNDLLEANHFTIKIYKATRTNRGSTSEGKI